GVVEDDHAAASARGSVRTCRSDAEVPPGRCTMSHHSPKKGSTSGTNTYPMPNHDHTAGWSNRAGSTIESAPITSTPTSSNRIATHAMRYQTTEPAKIR